MYCIQHCFICRPSDSTVSEDAGIEPRTVATLALAVRRSEYNCCLLWLKYSACPPTIYNIISLLFFFLSAPQYTCYSLPLQADVRWKVEPNKTTAEKRGSLLIYPMTTLVIISKSCCKLPFISGTGRGGAVAPLVALRTAQGAEQEPFLLPESGAEPVPSPPQVT
jgi:hypothetical protein